jgi:uncharacterized protein with PIN domain
VRALNPRHQLREIFQRLDLAGMARPLTLCLRCNAPLRAIDKQLVLDQLPSSVREGKQTFSTCDVCRRVFWEGSHWRKMRDLLDSLAQERTVSFGGIPASPARDSETGLGLGESSAEVPATRR